MLTGFETILKHLGQLEYPETCKIKTLLSRMFSGEIKKMKGVSKQPQKLGSFQNLLDNFCTNFVSFKSVEKITRFVVRKYKEYTEFF